MSTDVVATLNGQALDPNLATDLATYFQQSSALVDTCLPADSVFGPLGQTTCGVEIVQNGFYMAINGLAPGTYTLEFGADGAASGFGAIDTITVTAPEPVSVTLFGIGLFGLGLARRKRG